MASAINCDGNGNRKKIRIIATSEDVPTAAAKAQKNTRKKKDVTAAI